MSGLTVSFTDLGGDRTAASLYLPEVLYCRQPTGDLGKLLAEFLRFQAAPSAKWQKHFAEAGYLAAAFVRWYWAMEQVEAEIIPYTGTSDWVVQCRSLHEYPTVAPAALAKEE